MLDFSYHDGVRFSCAYHIEKLLSHVSEVSKNANHIIDMDHHRRDDSKLVLDYRSTLRIVVFSVLYLPIQVLICRLAVRSFSVRLIFR